MKNLWIKYMAGHSQFKNIMHRKGAQDAKRAKTFARIAREITVAVKFGNDDPKQNPRLRNAIINARSENMPNDKIKNAIQKGTSGESLNNLFEIRYEGYGYNGVAVIIETITDNKNRTASEVRTTLNKHGGNLAENGAVSFNFERIGELTFEKNNKNYENLLEEAIEAGASDFSEKDNLIIIHCSTTNLGKIRDKLVINFGEPKSIKLIWKVLNTISVSDNIFNKVLALCEALEDNEDVQAVYTNLVLEKNINKC